jgi:hypothetical protein
MVKKFEVREVSDGPPWQRWLATFKEWNDAAWFAEQAVTVPVEIVEVWDDA